MRRAPLYAPAFYAAALLMTSSALAAPALDRPKPTRATDLVEEQFGEKIADPYRWLENDVRHDAEVKGWVDTQNTATNAYLNTLPGRDIFAGRIKQLINFERHGVPRKAGTRYFYTKNDGLQNQSVLWVREGIEGTPKVLIDPNTWAKDGATALAEWAPSDDGRHFLYAVQDGGSDWRTLKVIDVTSGAALSDEIKWVKFSGLAWKADGSGFFYSRFPEPSKDGKFQSLNTNQAVWFHTLGTPQSQDMMVYATPDQPKLGHSAQVTDDGRYLLVTSSSGTDDRYELHFGGLDGAGPVKLKTLIKGLEHDWQLAGSVGSKFAAQPVGDAGRCQAQSKAATDRCRNQRHDGRRVIGGGPADCRLFGRCEVRGGIARFDREIDHPR